MKLILFHALFCSFLLFCVFAFGQIASFFQNLCSII